MRFSIFISWLYLFESIAVGIHQAKTTDQPDTNRNMNKIQMIHPNTNHLGSIPTEIPKKITFQSRIYFGDCPVDSRKTVKRLDSLRACRHGGNYVCHELCEKNQNQDEIEVMGGRCLNVGGHSFGPSYGLHKGYTGQGGICYCFLCEGPGVSDVKCMVDIEKTILPSDTSGKRLCFAEKDYLRGYDQELMKEAYIVDLDTKSEPTETSKSDDIPLQAQANYQYETDRLRHPVTHVSNRRCNDKCFLAFINAEKGVCRRSPTNVEQYECICKTCGSAQRYRQGAGGLGTVDCSDLTPDAATNAIYLPLPTVLQRLLCGDPESLVLNDHIRQGDDSENGSGQYVPDIDSGMKKVSELMRNGMGEDYCSMACVDALVHNPVQRGECQIDTFNCICHICKTAPCVYDTWNDWSYCSVRCNGGTRRRKRPLIAGNKNDCTNTLEHRRCNDYPCPVSCVVSYWNEWSACYGECGTGNQVRQRQILVPPLYGGDCKYHDFISHRYCDTGKKCKQLNVVRRSEIELPVNQTDEL